MRASALTLLVACAEPTSHELTPEPMFVRAPAIAATSDGDGFGVAWVGMVGTDTAYWQIWFALVDRDGAVLRVARPIAAADEGGAICLAPLRTGWILIYRSGTPFAFEAVRLAPDGEAETRPRPLGGASSGVSCKSTGDAVALLYTDGDNLELQIVSPDLSATPTISIEPVAMSTKRDPVLAHDPETGALTAVWEENNRIRWAPLDASGMPLMPSTTVDDDGKSQFGATAVATRTGTFVSWFSSIDRVRRFMHVGSEPWSTGASLIPDGRSESIDLGLASRGNEVLFALQASDSDPAPRIELARIEANVEPSEPPERTPIGDPLLFHVDPKVAATADRFAVAYIGIGDGGMRLFVETFE